MRWRPGKSYSTDLRGRVFAAIDNGQSVAEAAEVFDVSLSFIYKALARRRQTGEMAARAQRNHQPLKLAAYHAAIAEEVAARPDVTLEELRGWLRATHDVDVSMGLMHNTLIWLGLVRKKSPVMPRSNPEAT